jgi:hypothetical protein
MEPKRRRESVLVGIVAALLIAIYAAFGNWPRPASMQFASSNQQAPGPQDKPRRTARAEATGSAGAPQAEAPQVHLDALGEDRPRPEPAGRDLFRFREKPPPPPPPPPAPPPVPPIALRFIGVVDTPPPGKRVAVLSDGRGAPVYGHEGDTVLGQYRIVRIGAESIEMSYLDGRGRQTIRLSGS